MLTSQDPPLTLLPTGDPWGETALICDHLSVEPAAPRRPQRPQPDVEPGLAPASERELIAAILQRDRKAATRFVAAHIDAVYAYVRYRLAPRGDLVDDIVQEVFLAALNGLASFQAGSSLKTWLIGIARHKVEDVYRQRLRTTEPLDEEEPFSQPPTLDDEIDLRRVRARARDVLARLPERYGLMLLWRYLGTAKRPRDGGSDRHDREEHRADARTGAREIP